MSWSSKRQFTYLGGLLVFIIVFIILPGYFLLRQEPTCFDGVKNGDEAGVDCGGSCELVCSFDTQKPIIHWDESFKVREGVWTAAAYIENPNGAYALDVPYTFKLLDSGGILVAQKPGQAFIPPRQNFVILESSIEVGNRLPSQEFFEFGDEISWIRSEASQVDLRVEDVILSERDGITRLRAAIFNPGTEPVGNVQVTGILYDINGNAIAVSETFIERVPPNARQEAFFTWPGELGTSVTKKEVIYIVLPD